MYYNIHNKAKAIIFWVLFWLVQSVLMSGGEELQFYLIKNMVIVGLQFSVVLFNSKVLIPIFFDRQKYLLYTILSIVAVYLIFAISFGCIGLVMELFYSNFNSGGFKINFASDFWEILSGSSFYSLALVCSLVYMLLKKNQAKEVAHVELQQKLMNTIDGSVIIKEGHKTHKLSSTNVYFIKGLKEYVVWHTSKGNIVALQTMKSIESDYSKMNFLRVHKSYIVNMDLVDSFESANLRVNNEKIPVGRAYKKNVIDFLL